MDEPLLWVAVASAALSGFFALNGYALRESPRHKLDAAFAGRRGRRLAALLDSLPELHLVCGLLRLLCNLTLLVVLLYILEFEAGRPELLSILAAVALSVAIISIFSMAIPYAWARHAGAQVLAATAPVLLALRRGLWPLVFVMRAFDKPIRRLSGIPDPHTDVNDQDSNGRDAQRQTAVRAEILQVASEGQAEGAVDSQEMEMIESVIAFGDRRAAEIMTPRTDVVALSADASNEQIWRTVIEAGHTRIPVYDGDIDNVVGVLHAKDLLAADDAGQVELRRLMRKPFFIPETKQLDDLLREFKARKSHMAIVLDEYGGTAGLVTLEDLLEEIVGEISDEHDRPESVLMKRLDERTCEVDGRMYIDDLNEALGLDLPEEADYDTVAGFVYSQLGFIPPVGQTLSAYGATFTVLAADDRRITRLRVELPAEPQA